MLHTTTSNAVTDTWPDFICVTSTPLLVLIVIIVLLTSSTSNNSDGRPTGVLVLCYY